MAILTHTHTKYIWFATKKKKCHIYGQKKNIKISSFIHHCRQCFCCCLSMAKRKKKFSIWSSFDRLIDLMDNGIEPNNNCHDDDDDDVVNFESKLIFIQITEWNFIIIFIKEQKKG